MKRLNLLYLFMLCTVFCSCDFKCSVGNSKETVKTNPVSSSDNTPLNGAVIKNDIDLDVTGVKLKEAYLVDADYKPLTENRTALGEKIYIIIKMDTGWVKENGRSFIGVGERISTKEGGVLVDAADIFKDQSETGMSAEDAKVVSLSAVVTDAKPGVKDFVVKFRVWDKKGTGEVKGKYNFSLK
jgi:hypothetical protein